MCISLAYEGNKVAGCFHSVTFLHDGFEHPYANAIKKNFLVFDYLPKTLPNSIDSKTGLIKADRPIYLGPFFVEFPLTLR